MIRFPKNKFNAVKAEHLRYMFSTIYYFFLLLLPLWIIGLISQFVHHFTDGRTPWTGDQLVTKPLPKHSTTQTQNKWIHTSNIHALSGI
jgi:hypothetical protein